MRRHVKALLAGSTSGRGSSLSSFCGAFATRRASSGLDGSGAPSASRVPRVSTCVLAGLLSVLFLLSLTAAPAVAAEECPNEIRRQEQGIAALRLADCRAYENTSPGSQPSASGGTSSESAQVSISGDRVGYRSKYPAIGEVHSGFYYLSIRGANGWSTHTVQPQEEPDASGLFACSPDVFFSTDMTKNILEEDLYDPEFVPPGYCGSNEEVLDPREVSGHRNLFIHDVTSGDYELVSVIPEAVTPEGNSYFRAGSDDLTTIAFTSQSKLTPESLSGTNLYVWREGDIRLVTILPDGSPVVGALAGWNTTNRMSADGDRIFFTYGGNLYVRVNATQPQSAIAGGECTEPENACTIQIDKSQGPGASGGGIFEFATDEGTKAFFTSDHKMTADSTATSGNEDLYEFDVDTGVLTDLTVNAGEPAEVWGATAWSDDGSYVYFLAEAALAPGALPGGCEHYNEGATCNLYVAHEGTIDFIAAVSVDDLSSLGKGEEVFFKFSYGGQKLNHHWGSGQGQVQTSPSGQFLAFGSYQSITGYDNVNTTTGNPVNEIFLYNAATEELTCISCDPSGEPPNNFGAAFNGAFGAMGFWSVDWRKHLVNDNGQVFFNSPAALVPGDTNEAVDVYEWSNGEPHLISTGNSPEDADVVEASPDGSDIFFTTAENILPSDQDGALTLYDARANGGFAEPPALPGCEGEACRGAGSSAPTTDGAGTAAFQGPGNRVGRHLRDCGALSARAKKLSRLAKSLRRRASAAGPAEAERLLQRANELAKKGKKLSEAAPRCRRANRRDRK